MISVFILNFEFPKILTKTWGHVLFWEEQGNAPQDFGRDDFMLKGYAQCVICMKQQK